MLYFDHAASTQTFSYISKGLEEKAKIFANPSSVHQRGQEARHILDEARYNASKSLEANLENIIFTSGATESLNLAIIGHFLFIKNKENKGEFIIQVSPLNHSSVFKTVNFLSKNFGVKVEKLPIDKLGFIDVEAISDKDLSKSFMVICEHGNSETGVLQPVAKLGKRIRRIEGRRPKFVVDTAASVVDTEISLNRQVCDGLVISGEKFGGLKGSGILLRKKDFEIESIISGSQEFGYRGGTENLLGIWAIGEALVQISEKRNVYHEKYLKLHNFLRNFFVHKFTDIKITTPGKDHLAHIFHFILPSGSANVFVQQCDLLGLCISAGSACSSGNVRGSAILMELKYSDAESLRGVRISFGRETEIEDMEKMTNILEEVLDKGNF